MTETNEMSFSTRVQSPVEAFGPSMLHLRDPAHKRIRSLVSRAFTHESVERWRPRIREIADSLLRNLHGRESLDLIAEFASPFPIIVIAEILGVDSNDLQQFKSWSEAKTELFNPSRTRQQTEALLAADEGLNNYFACAVESRRQKRGDDLVSALVVAEESGQRLTSREIVLTCNLLLLAGTVTTTDLVGNGVLALLKHPEQMHKLRQSPGLLSRAVEKILRYDPPEVRLALTASLSALAASVFALTGFCPFRSTRIIALGLGRTQAAELESDP